MRVGMHEMHALRVRDFLHDDDSASPQLVLLMEPFRHRTLSAGS